MPHAATAKGKSGLGERPFEGSAWKTPPPLVIFILSPSLLLPPFLLPLLLLTTTAHPHLLSLFAPGQLAGEELLVG